MEEKFQEIKGTYEIKQGEKILKKFDEIWLFNNLMFQKDCDIIFDSINKILKPKGVFMLSTFNKRGIMAISIRLLHLIGMQKEVYHNSSFYKIGPYSFLSKKFIEKMCKKHKLKIIKKEYIHTNCLEEKNKV